MVPGTVTTFSTAASSPADGTVNEALTRTSSRDGLIGSGSGFATSGLSEGVHAITATVTDSHGLTDSATVTLSVSDYACP